MSRDVLHAARVYVRSCEICVKLILDGDVGYGCTECFRNGRPTLFCSQACIDQHNRRHHAPEGGQ